VTSARLFVLEKIRCVLVYVYDLQADWKVGKVHFKMDSFSGIVPQ
jgi:hypothetical protein